MNCICRTPLVLSVAAANVCCGHSPCVPVLWPLQELDYSLVGLHCSVLQSITGGVPAQVSLQRQEELHVELARDDMLTSSITMATLGRGHSEGAWMDTHCTMLLVSKVVWMVQQLGVVCARVNACMQVSHNVNSRCIFCIPCTSGQSTTLTLHRLHHTAVLSVTHTHTQTHTHAHRHTHTDTHTQTHTHTHTHTHTKKARM